MIEKVFIKQAYKNLELEKFFEENLERAGFNSVDIVKTPVATRVILKVAKPGLAIGYSGKNIKYLTDMLEKKFGLKNPHIEVRGIDHPEYDAKYRVSTIVNALEKGINWRTVMYRAVRDLSNLPLMGFELVFKGKLMAKGGRKQKYRVSVGYLKKVGGQVDLVREAKGTAYTKSGAIGVTLKLIPPNTVFPDKIGKEEIMEAAKKIFSEMTPEEQKEADADLKEREKEKDKEEKKDSVEEKEVAA